MLRNILEGVFSNLDSREKEIILRRFGIFSPKETLESIGNDFNISRERVRQIQNKAIEKIRNSIFNYEKDLDSIFSQTAELLEPLGIKRESSFFYLIKKELGYKDEEIKIFKLFTRITKKIIYHEEDINFYSFFNKNEEIYNAAFHTLKKLSSYFIENRKIIHPEERLIEIAYSEIKKHIKKEATIEDIVDFIKILKILGKNPFGFWGTKNNEYISPSNLGHKIYLILKIENKPMHFSEIYKKLEEIRIIEDESVPHVWKKKYTLESIKNELINNSLFSFVGNGKYGLKEWNLIEGTAKELILNYLKEKKIVKKDELWNFISKHREIKKSSFYIYLAELRKKIKIENDLIIYND